MWLSWDIDQWGRCINGLLLIPLICFKWQPFYPVCSASCFKTLSTDHHQFSQVYVVFFYMVWSVRYLTNVYRNSHQEELKNYEEKFKAGYTISRSPGNRVQSCLWRHRIRKFCRISRILWRHRQLWTRFPGNRLIVCATLRFSSSFFELFLMAISTNWSSTPHQSWRTFCILRLDKLLAKTTTLLTLNTEKKRSCYGTKIRDNK